MSLSQINPRSVAIEKVVQFATQSTVENDLKLKKAKAILTKLQEENKIARRMGSPISSHLELQLFKAENYVKQCSEQCRLAEIALGICAKAHSASIQMIPEQSNYLELMTSSCADASCCHTANSDVKSARLAWLQACHVAINWDQLCSQSTQKDQSEGGFNK